MISRDVKIEVAAEGGCWPGLLKMSEWKPREGKIVLYEDALAELSRRRRISIDRLISFALLHEFLHLLNPGKPLDIHALSSQLEALLL